MLPANAEPMTVTSGIARVMPIVDMIGMRIKEATV